MTTVEFELPFGYEDKDGNVHKTVTMRRVRNGDMIDLNSDPAIQKLAQRKDLEIDTSIYALAEAIKSGGSLSGLSGRLHPIANQMAQGAMIEMQTKMFSRVILSIGSIDNVHPGVLRDLTPVDFEVIQEKFDEFNRAPGKDGSTEVPFEPSLN